MKVTIDLTLRGVERIRYITKYIRYRESRLGNKLFSSYILMSHVGICCRRYAGGRCGNVGLELRENIWGNTGLGVMSSTHS